MTNPPIAIVLLTYKRTDYALRTIEAMRNNWRYDNTLWYVADDGSPNEEHYPAVLDALKGERVIGSHSERLSYGGSSNKAWHVAHDHADLTLWLEDDWILRDPFDPSQYARVLMENNNIGMVRLGHLPINLNARTCGYNGQIFLNISTGQQYMFSGNPSLRHRRARETWGPYPERINPGDTELVYDNQIQTAVTSGAPHIVWPLAIGEQGLFGHIGAVKSYTPPGG